MSQRRRRRQRWLGRPCWWRSTTATPARTLMPSRYVTMHERMYKMFMTARQANVPLCCDFKKIFISILKLRVKYFGC